MANLFGNINGNTYSAPNIDLFALARSQNNQPVKFRETEQGKNIPAVTVNISREGLLALHGKVESSVNLEKQAAELKFITEHQPIESFTNRLSRELQDSYVQFADENSGKNMPIEEKGNVLLNKFKSICDEIVSGYNGGNRIRFMEDATAEDGFVKLTQTDELSLLYTEFSDFVEKRFGKEHQEESKRVAEIVNGLKKVKQELGIGKNRYYEPEYIPDDFAEKLLSRAKKYMEEFL